jgi:cyclic pyranopterin phosphate synthase
MLTHIDANNRPTMVDVSEKGETLRTAIAESIVVLPEAVREMIHDGDVRSAKGPVFQTAIIAGTMAAKRTHDLIPFCHPLGIESCKIKIDLNDKLEAVIQCRVKVHHKTGVEMEALTGASVAALTVYDMCKALSHDIQIKSTRLITKTGVKSDFKATAVKG